MVLCWRAPIVLFDAIERNAEEGRRVPTAIDLTGFQSCAILLSIRAGGITFDATNKIEFVLTHSDNGTNYANVAATDINGKDAPTTVTNGIVKALTSAHASADVSEIGYIGGNAT
jgi:hypothetical protein